MPTAENCHQQSCILWLCSKQNGILSVFTDVSNFGEDIHFLGNYLSFQMSLLECVIVKNYISSLVERDVVKKFDTAVQNAYCPNRFAEIVTGVFTGKLFCHYRE
jgi:hypothetical protein